MKHATYEETLQRLMQATNSSKPAELAKALGITSQSVSQTRKKQQIPAQWIIDISIQYGVSADWLISGEGPVRRNEIPASERPPSPQYAVNEENEALLQEMDRRLNEVRAKNEELRRLLDAAKDETIRAYKIATQNIPSAASIIQEELGPTEGTQQKEIATPNDSSLAPQSAKVE